MNILKLRIKIVQLLIELNEQIFFYPKLKSYYRRRFPLTASSKRPLTIFDVGANKGQTIEFFLKINKNSIIYAFEPNPILYSKLIQKYAIHPNIHVFNLGVSNINGELELKETITDETSTFEEFNYDSKYLKLKADVLGVCKEKLIKKKYIVQVTRLDEFIIKKNINKIDILKIDTEGHELKCLMGLFPVKSCEIDYIQLERHNDDMYSAFGELVKIEALLATFGYRSNSIIKHGFGDLDECIYER
jgi:FkbM family methyltransferase